MLAGRPGEDPPGNRSSIALDSLLALGIVPPQLP
jgi:hypothetical protein